MEQESATIKEQESAEQRIRRKIDYLSTKQEIIDASDLREIQDFNFENRSSKAVVIPNGFYKKTPNSIEHSYY